MGSSKIDFQLEMAICNITEQSYRDLNLSLFSILLD